MQEPDFADKNLRGVRAGIPALLLAFSGLLLAGGLTRGQGWGDDFAAYIMQAESIARGNPGAFVEASRFTFQYSTFPVGPVAYPWGYPLLLAPVVAWFGPNIMALKAVGAICFLLFLTLLWFGFRHYHPAARRLILVGLFALNPVMLDAVNGVISDLPFLLISTLSVLLIGRVVVRGRRLTSQFGDRVLIGTAVALAFLVRTNGALLLPTLAVAQAVAGFRDGVPGRSAPADRPARRWFAVALPYGVFAAWVLAFGALFPDGGSSHFSILGSLTPATVFGNFLYYSRVPAHFFDGLPTGLIVLIYGATVLAALAGMARRWRSDHHLIVYMALTLLLYSLWPFRQTLRFMFPVLPFLFSFALSGLEGPAGADGSGGAGRRRALRLLPVLALVGWFGLQSSSAAIDNLHRDREEMSGPYARTSVEMFSFIREHVGAQSTVAFFKPRAMWLLAGRRSLMLNRPGDLSRAEYLCFYRRPDAYNQLSREEVGSLLAGGGASLEYANADFELYRLRLPPG